MKKKPEDNIFDQGFSKGRSLGYIEAIRDMISKEERVIMLVDDGNNNFQIESFVVESKHLRIMLEALLRDRTTDN